MLNPTVSHIELELEALYELSRELILGKKVDIDYSLTMELDGHELTVIYIDRNCSKYMLTMEDSNTLELILRSLEIPELHIALPSPIFVSVGEKSVTVGDLCEV